MDSSCCGEFHDAGNGRGVLPPSRLWRRHCSVSKPSCVLRVWAGRPFQTALPTFKRLSGIPTGAGGPDSAPRAVENFWPANTTEVLINGTAVRALLDTGADRSVICAKLVEQLGLVPRSGSVRALQTASVTSLEVKGEVNVTFTLGQGRFRHNFLVCEPVSQSVILGIDFLARRGAVISCKEGRILLDDGRTEARMETRLGFNDVRVRSIESQLIPPRAAVFHRVYSEGGIPIDGMGIVTPVGTEIPPGLLIASSVVTAADGECWVSVLNPTDQPIRIPTSCLTGVFDTVDELCALPEPCTSGVGSNVAAALEQLEDTDLAPEEKAEVGRLMREFADTFVEEGKPLGRTTLYYHRISTGDQEPIKVRGRRVPPHQRTLVDEMLTEMTADGVIRPSSSPWSSPILLVKKKDGTPRCCVDFRKLNECTVRDAFPLPRIDESLDALSGAKYFTVLDLKSGYWQVPLEEASKEKTAFATHRGLFEFNVLPMGLANAPAAFSRLMNNVLAGLTWSACLVYLDDTIVIGRTFNEHMENLRVVLDRFRRANLQLNPRKCQWFQSQVRYLGHVVSREGVHTDPNTIEKVRSWPRPLTQKQLRGFLGLSSYYRKFIAGFARIAAPLHRLTGKHARFVWSPECEAAFCTLRERLCAAPILALPDFSETAGTFVLDTDASDEAIGAVLAQRGDDGEERVIAYGSRCLNPAERNYCVTQKEMLAMVHFLGDFRAYLLGKPFVVRTDHAALTWLRSFKEPSGQVARWIQKMQEFDFETEYRPNPKHTNADALSRRPHRQHGECPSCGDTVKRRSSRVNVITWAQGWTDEDLKAAQLQFSATAHVIAWIRQERDAPPQLEGAAGIPELPQLIAEWSHLALRDDVLQIRRPADAEWRTVLPPSWREQALRQMHNNPMGGHPGVETTYQKLRSRVWWPNLRSAVDEWVRSCGVCGQCRGPNPSSTAPLRPNEPGEPFGRLCIDIVGPLPTTREGNRFILVMVDAFSKWAEAVALKRHTAKEVATAILHQWTARYGVPREILSDQGAEFESAVFRHICKIMGIRKIRSSPYHPMANGGVERLNRTLKSLLLGHSSQDREQWDQTLPFCMWAYRSNVHHSTGCSPARLTLGRELRFPIDVTLEANDSSSWDAQDYAAWLQESIRCASRSAREHLVAAKQLQKRQYDRRATPMPHYEVGDMVWVRNDGAPTAGLSAKLTRPWRGPFLVTRMLGDVNVEVRDPATPSRPTVVHVNRVKPCPTDVRLEEASPRVQGGAPPLLEVEEHFVPEVGQEVVVHTTNIQSASLPQDKMEVDDRLQQAATGEGDDAGPLPDVVREKWGSQLAHHFLSGEPLSNPFLRGSVDGGVEWFSAVLDSAVARVRAYFANRLRPKASAQRRAQVTIERFNEIRGRVNLWLTRHPAVPSVPASESLDGVSDQLRAEAEGRGATEELAARMFQLAQPALADGRPWELIRAGLDRLAGHSASVSDDVAALTGPPAKERGQSPVDAARERARTQPLDETRDRAAPRSAFKRPLASEAQEQENVAPRRRKKRRKQRGPLGARGGAVATLPSEEGFLRRAHNAVHAGVAPPISCANGSGRDAGCPCCATATCPSQVAIPAERPSSTSYVKALRRDPPQGARRPPPSDILMLGDSNFTRAPFNRPPYVNVSVGGLTFAGATQRLRQLPLRPGSIGAVLLGLGTNDQQAPPAVRSSARELQRLIDERFPGVPVYHIQTPENKMPEAIRARVTRNNNLAAGIFPALQPTLVNPVVGIHYTDAERRVVSESILSRLSQLQPAFRGQGLPI